MTVWAVETTHRKNIKIVNNKNFFSFIEDGTNKPRHLLCKTIDFVQLEFPWHFFRYRHYVLGYVVPNRMWLTWYNTVSQFICEVANVTIRVIVPVLKLYQHIICSVVRGWSCDHALHGHNEYTLRRTVTNQSLRSFKLDI